ncbi:hypothetical protein RJ640_004267 [Escallonia rubra]|uniref:Uncharacterized protein n=1 Tax=Escallonia rubra TaxID=112253 RepID=A0AA88RC21_9ASTE|nr:hypothetical protein RJ640_004267 [Escallonia rubra]
MEFSQEWKSLWPIASVFSPPLLLSTGGGGGGGGDSKESKRTGPLIFNPSPDTLTKLFTCPCLSSPLFNPFPSLSLPRFLQTSSSILPSASSSIASTLGPQLPDAPSLNNSLELLHCPERNSVFAFYPTGPNSDRVGFVLLSVKDSHLDVGLPRGRDGFFSADNALNHQILRLLVNPIDDSPCHSGDSSLTTFGYLLACTMYSVFWYSVGIQGVGSGLERPQLDFLGSKLFKTSEVVHACWSPHLPEESVVLLGTGELFLFDLASCSRPGSLVSKVRGKKLRVVWGDSTVMKEGHWLGCEFSWHPRILIVAHSSSVFLVDLRSEGSKVSCLLKAEILSTFSARKNDQFAAFSRAGYDGFYFVVASSHLLLLCDVRNPLMPLLQWAHDLDNPRYITVFSLSELRSHPRDDTFEWASESGYCILVGSFWNCEFSLFCYGPECRGSVASEISKFSKSFFAWELPSEISLSARGCHCGSCVVREEFAKDALPEWIKWQHKKEIVLGFGILHKDLSAQLFEPDSFGGFTLIRLMSSGSLESQRYLASWEFVNFNEEAHNNPPLRLEDTLLYEKSIDDGEYRFLKKYCYLKLDCLNAYLKGYLAKVLVEKEQKIGEGPQETYSFTLEFHQQICQKLKAFGLSTLEASPTVDDVLKDVRSPTSIMEIASSSIWARLPAYLLCLAFSTYSELMEVLGNHRKVSLEFLDVPDQLHLPPFSFQKPSLRSSKWSSKVQPGNAFVGPGLPLQVLVTLCKRRMEEANGPSADLELEHLCNIVMQVANELTKSDSGSELHTDHAISLADDREGMRCNSQNTRPFSVHEPVAFSSKFSTGDPTPERSVCDNERYTSFVYRTRQKELVPNARMEMVGSELFDAHCPAELEFDDCNMNFEQNEVKIFKLLKRQYSNFKEDFGLYQKYCDS